MTPAANPVAVVPLAAQGGRTNERTMLSKTNKKLITTGAAILMCLVVSAAPASAAPAGDHSSREAGTLIVGGRNATEAYEGMASLGFDRAGTGDFSHRCGASLHDPWHLVTAAHCVTNPDGFLNPDRFRVRLGSHDHTSGGILAGVRRILPHADWDWATGTDPVADIAVLRLDRAVWLTPFPIASRVNGQAPVRLLGWGSTQPSGAGPLPDTLQELDTGRLPAVRCAAAGITAGELCISSPRGISGACYGDSGGPALQRYASRWWVAIGGASRETSPTCGVGPTIYTDYTYYKDWIRRVIVTEQVPPRTTPASRGDVTTDSTRALSVLAG